MHASELRDRAILSLDNAQVVGHVDEPLFDTRHNELIGFQLKHGTFSAPQAVSRNAISTMGQDALTISTPEAVKPEAEIPALSGAVALKDIIGTKIVTEAGDVVGTVQDVTLDDDARRVVGYLLPPDSLMGRIRHEHEQVAASRVMHIGTGGVMTIADAGDQQESTAG